MCPWFTKTPLSNFMLVLLWPPASLSKTPFINFMLVVFWMLNVTLVQTQNGAVYEQSLGPEPQIEVHHVILVHLCVDHRVVVEKTELVLSV